MATTVHSTDLYPIRSVPLTRPFLWLSMAWDDLMHHKGASLAYGWLVSTLGALMLAYERHPFFVAAMTSGFLLVGPIITAGLCELSRRLEAGEEANFETSLLPLKHHRKSLLDFAEVLLLISLLWFSLSALILYWAAGSIAPSVASTVWGDVMMRLTPVQVVTYLRSQNRRRCRHHEGVLEPVFETDRFVSQQGQIILPSRKPASLT